MNTYAFFAALVIACSVFSATAQAGLFGDFPDIILCQTPDGTVIGRIDSLQNGTARYKDLNSRVATIGPDLIVRRENSPNCDGQSVAELRKEGRAFDLVTR